MEPENVKALYRRAVASFELADYLDAKRDLTSAARLEPKNREVRTKLAACKEAAEQQKRAEERWASSRAQEPPPPSKGGGGPPPPPVADPRREREQREQRDAFRALLRKKARDGVLTPHSSWHAILAEIRGTPEYLVVAEQGASTSIAL